MKRVTFIKLASAFAAAPLLSSYTSWTQQERLKNWAGNLEYSTGNVFYPKTVEEVQALVKNNARLRVLGTRHCFNPIADSTNALLSTKNLNRVVALDEQAHTVTVEGGIKYGELCPYLEEKGYALHNLASLPHISVAGSCTTATHGSGVRNGNLASVVQELELVTADGSLVHLSRQHDTEVFTGAVVGLGALGVITKVTLAVEPSYQMRQYVFLKLPLTQLKSHFDQIVAAGYSVSLFTDWQQDSVNEVWIKNRVDAQTSFEGIRDFYGATAATTNLHPIADLSAVNCTEQMGVPGPWYDRLPHFKMGFTPSSGKELQAEYFVPFANAMDAILAIYRLGAQIGPHLLISEIRTIAQDDLWLSPCRNQPSVAIHFTWKQDWPAVQRLLPLIEKELAPYNVKPHWGKLFTMPANVLTSKYEKLPDFKKLAATYDPAGKFRNDFLNTNLYASI